MSRFPVAVLFALSAFGADITGLWMGQQPGRNGEVQDVAFRFKLDGQTLSGKLFGDEFDLAIGDASLTGDRIKFIITTTNYYTRGQSVFAYEGTVKDSEMELVRERIQTPEEKAANRPVFKQTIKLKKIT